MYIWIFRTRLIIQSSSWATEVPCKLNARLVLRIFEGFHLFSLATTGRPLKLIVQAWLIWIQAVETSSAHNGSPSLNALYAGGECGRERVRALPGYFTTRGELEGTMAWSCRDKQNAMRKNSGSKNENTLAWKCYWCFSTCKSEKKCSEKQGSEIWIHAVCYSRITNGFFTLRGTL